MSTPKQRYLQRVHDLTVAELDEIVRKAKQQVKTEKKKSAKQQHKEKKHG